MKKIFAIVGAVLMIGMTSCVQNLNVESIDPNSKSTIDMNELFVKCYATMALTGQQGPDGNGDVAGVDEGTSSFYRMMFALNEYCADQIYWIWPDVGVDDIRKATWTASNTLIKGVYSRFYFDITLCNLFIDKFGEEAGARKTAEVRFIRALNYYYLLDMFGNVPKVWKSGLSELPEQYKRADLYADLTAELEDLMQDLAPAGQRESYYRVDQAAAWLLLSRIYLNAEIYTGKDAASCKADYDKAAKYAEMVMNSSYDLASQYRYLFMGDNDNLSAVNDAYKEIILPVAQDGIEIQSWGGSLFLIASCYTSGMPASGTTEAWKCIRSRAQLVQLFCPELDRPKTAKTLDQAKSVYGKYYGGAAQITAAAGDSRAMFINAGSSDSYVCNFWTQNKDDEFLSGWGIVKYSNLMADGNRTAHDTKFPDTDLALMRKAEAYLNYAEAVLRGADQLGMTADAAINEVRHRAGAAENAGYTLDDVLDERGRELYAEGCRRSDLIRFHKFTGKAYPWEWKGGAILGAQANVEDFRALYPLPLAEVTANSNLKQNEGY
ncbi:MAG: RagB/SusD family nutrient uptake outer membrane protein [Paludibacteraceae bacterium]|nr:RagB/SusD family nutrient uptake outer membrane protein [Paludibacteraceae bacterium]